MSVIEVIRNKSLVEYISGTYPGDNLELQPDGTWRSKCQLHHGTNATSFTVFPDNRFYCYSCNAVGDLITYVMERESLPFFQAFELLADKYGIDIDNDSNYKQQKTIAQFNAKKCIEFQRGLPKVYEYLTKKRGLTDETIKLFQLGACEYKGKDSKPHLALTIPMQNLCSTIVAFGYRFFNETPKYKNSKNNELFQKGSYLFNANNAIRIIPKTKRLYVVEGHIDAMSIHQLGEAAVAYCGITFTKDHVKIIKQITERIEGATIILVPDNDDKASKFIDRGRMLFMKHYQDANVRVAKIQ